jgi:hypothetical protein
LLTAPYSIYVSKRPLRIAFLIENKPESMPIIDAILAHNRDRWGGRYNPIVLTDGESFTTSWWSLLESVDSDILKSFVPVSDDLIVAIERRLSPYLIQQPDPHDCRDGYWRMQLHDEGLSLLPTASNVRAASWATGQSSLVLFQTHWKDTDPLIKRFVESNFGGYSPPIHAVSRALEGVRTRQYTITDASSLVTPLTELSTFESFTYPIQLCSIPKQALAEVQHDRFDETFHVVIGDTPADVAYFWNRPSSTRQWRRTYLNQMWLPLDVATDPRLTTALSSWLQRAADPNGSHQGRIRFVSLSLSQERLREVVQPLTRELRVFRDVDVLRDIERPKTGLGIPGSLPHNRMDLYRATGTTERLTLQEPDVLEGAVMGEHWMADLYIEFRPERYPTIGGRQLWWQLPRLNTLAFQMFHRPSRVLRTRYPSVLMRRGEPRLDIALLDDITVFALLAAASNQSYYTRDPRGGTGLSSRTPYHHARRSEKGRYLSGLLDLFGGLHPATKTLEARYWRRMFDLLSGRTAHTDSERLAEVGNALRRRLRANRAQFYEDDKAMTWLTNYVLKVARGLRSSSRDLEFRVFEQHARQEMDDFNASHTGHEAWSYSQEDLLQGLTDLTERGVLLMGIQARCPACGYRAWHHIDEARQTLRCGGCNAAFPMPPEQRWHYRLNNLVRAAYAEHGLLPVVLLLGQLLMVARSAFLFAPCLDLFEAEGERPVGDLDIAAILDGQFVIGEVKQSRDLFDEAAFVKMEGVARRLLPDVLLFASIEREPNGLITREIRRLSEALGPLGIAVRWYPLHAHIFSPSPVR